MSVILQDIDERILKLQDQIDALARERNRLCSLRQEAERELGIQRASKL